MRAPPSGMLVDEGNNAVFVFRSAARSLVLSLLLGVVVGLVAGRPVARGRMPPPFNRSPRPRRLPAPRRQGSAVAPSDPATVLMHINDLGLLRALRPLQLTQAQISALVEVLRAVEKDDAARVRQDEEALRALAGDVARAHTAALAGTPIPTELETRVADAGKAADARLRKAKNDAVLRILVVARASLTPEQQKQIAQTSLKVSGASRSRVLREAYTKDAEKAQNLGVAYFIEDVLLNPRAITVLGQMKPAVAAPAPPPPASAGAPAGRRREPRPSPGS
jgi:hypothetical protein